ncbi:spinster family MFS transporter [Polaromonas glacialis]|uniref:spinster family MFS transporter n=1 Tax=Polaromonas glacialis TaxID=866564 RepID=UPI00049584F2|nr:MFS transporter [Polaromonas glacialis]
MTQPAHGWRSHYALLMLMFVYTMSFIDRQIMGILVQPIKQEFGVSDTAMGVLTGLAFSLFYSVLAIPFGRYADRANRRNFVAYCCAAWSVMTALCGMATGFWSLALARMGVAVGEAGGGPPSISMIADHYPQQQRGRAMSVYMLGPQLGILLGLTLGGWIAQHHGWRAAFLVMSVPGVLAALLLRFTVVEPRRGQWDAPGSVPVGAAAEPMRVLLRDLWASRAFVRITLACLLMGVTGYGIGIWTPAFLVRSHGMSLQGAGIVMGLMGGVFAMLGALTSGWLSDKLGKRDARWRIGVPMLGCLLAMPSGLAFFMMPAGGAWQVGGMLVPHALGFYVVFAFTAVWWTAPVYAVLAELVPAHRRSSGMAIFNLGITMLGGGLGPLLVGMLSDFLVPQFGNEALRWALAATTGICFLLGMLVFAWTIRPYAVERLVPAVAPAPAVPRATVRA